MPTLVVCFLAAWLLTGLPAVAQPAASDADVAFGVLEGHASGDPTTAVSTLRTLAATDPHAATLLGLAYYHGLGVNRDRERALGLWREAAAAGNGGAAYNAGLELLRRDDGGAETVALLEQAAAGGDTLACFAAGTALADSGDIALRERAAQWLQRAAEHGYAPAQHNLALLLVERDGPGDHDAARTWLTQAGMTFAPAKARIAAIEAPPSSATAPATSTMPIVDTDTAGVAQAATAPSPPREKTHLAEDTIGDAEWVFSQQPQRYTLQVAAAARKAGITRLLQQVRGDRPAATFLHRPDAREPWTGVLGLFDDYGAARAALAELPPSLQSNAPWIRRFEVLQRELEAHRRDDP